MTNSQRLEAVRNRLCQWVSDQGADAETEHVSSKILSESMLIRDGFFCGRCFRTAEYRAIWFIEEDELKIYSHSGSLQCVFHRDEIDAHEEAEAAEESPAAEESIIRMPIRSDDASHEPIRRAA
ncbi:hypothetical protein Pla52o_09600 [Novipirellula galeiformis]|uniref:Uncharacterized protein n=1 Tax=Novipirellula galeiformis TaxID=2528004 RepID=A0A5C6CRC1_9BACT|nr:hypothetical protein [Novipirellula galeiformis]TWU27100.1 hypothetical protein Pla52o_09600 [Novipirellula galeiformis]